MAEDVSSREEFEAACFKHMRQKLEASYWERLEGIAIESVSLVGEYPDTAIEVVFRPIRDRMQTQCRFGWRVELWPAESANPEEATRFWDVYLMEYVGTGRGARRIFDGPCDPDSVNW